MITTMTDEENDDDDDNVSNTRVIHWRISIKNNTDDV